jgi:ABC-type transport system involved in multi-copper enzyme maturation permease subunit
MTWVIWRQQRLTLLISLGIIGLVGAGLLALRLAATAALDDLGLTGCLPASPDTCPAGALAAFDQGFTLIIRLLPLVFLALPVLLGAFTGAPLFAREYEQGTHIFSLTQSISRRRWLTSKVAVAGLPLTCAMLALGLIASWALQPLSYLAYEPMTVPGFESQGLVIGAYFLLAFAISATAGLYLRNSIAAIAAALVLYAAAIVLLGNLARPHYLPPERINVPVGPDAAVTESPSRPSEDDWIVAGIYLDADGAPARFSYAECDDMSRIRECLIEQGVITESFDYHPTSRFWAFQAIESGLASVLALLVLALGAWRLRHRPT